MAASNGERSCWVTLLTRPSYLPGVVVLAHTLDKCKSDFPLIVQYTVSLGDDAILALETEGQIYGRLVPQRVELLLPPKGSENSGSVAERFKDTFTKLRAFQVYQQGYTRAVFLDADNAIFRHPDSFFDTRIPSRDWLGVNHACVCNLDNDAWAASEWHKGNCAYTPLQTPRDVADFINGVVVADARSVQYLGQGQDLQFPDQDFLADFFRNKWQPVSWKYNALKTMRYWHPRIWSDKDLVVLQYIVDKPWERHISDKGIAGHLGRDGITHQWWWDAYTEWKIVREGRAGNELLLQLMDKLVACKEPFTEVIPLPQRPGELADVGTYP